MRMDKIILASKSEVRKKILLDNGIFCEAEPSKVDEEVIKRSLLQEGASPEIISKNLAELKANKVSNKMPEELVLGADSVIDLGGEIISKPKSREEALDILKKMNGKIHFLIYPNRFTTLKSKIRVFISTIDNRNCNREFIIIMIINIF